MLKGQVLLLEEADNRMVMLDRNNAESILMELLKGDSDCVPVLNNLGHM